VKIIRFLDLAAAYLELKEEIDSAVSRVLRSGWYIGGDEVEAFEEQFSRYCNVKHTIGVANGLDALTLSLRAMDIQPGDEVIVPANTYIATWLAVSICGGKVVPVEPDPITLNICPKHIENALTRKTKFVLPVHLYGLSAELEPIYQLANKFGLKVLEDGAQAHGAEYAGRRVGSHGATVAWSFYPGKNLGGMGDAGAITTNDSDLAKRLRKLRNYGSSIKYVNDERGHNSRLDPIQAAILGVKLRHLDEWNNRRRRIADLYSSIFSDSGLILPVAPPDYNHAWHLYVVRSNKRDELRRSLELAGIETLIHYPIPPHLQAAYADHDFVGEQFPITKCIAETCLSLPIGPHLHAAEAEAVAKAVVNALHGEAGIP
jgi:dTDP-4-amino-4,6-dideoxygalactose transaminase